MANNPLPSFLMFTRRKRGMTRQPTGEELVRPGDGQNDSDGGATLVAPAPPAQADMPAVPATRPRRATPSPGLSDAVSTFLSRNNQPVPVSDEPGELATSVTQQPTLPVPTRRPDHSPGAFEPSYVPVAEKARALPAPGEDAANDARVRDRISAAGGYGDGSDGATATRKRIVDPTGRLEKQIDYERQNPAQDSNGRGRSAVKMAARLFLDGFVRGGVPGAVRGGIAGGVLGAVDKSADEQYAQQKRVGGYQHELGALRENEKQKLTLEDKRADIGVKNANRGWLEARPGIEASKLDAGKLKTAQTALQREIGNRLREPREFDASDAYDSDLLQRAQSLGVNFSPGMFGDFKNPATMEVVDPSDSSARERPNSPLIVALRLGSPLRLAGRVSRPATCSPSARRPA
jgi:hypothetical protein